MTAALGALEPRLETPLAPPLAALAEGRDRGGGAGLDRNALSASGQPKGRRLRLSGPFARRVARSLWV